MIGLQALQVVGGERNAKEEAFKGQKKFRE
jgi:hypothetical protein